MELSSEYLLSLCIACHILKFTWIMIVIICRWRRTYPMSAWALQPCRSWHTVWLVWRVVHIEMMILWRSVFWTWWWEAAGHFLLVDREKACTRDSTWMSSTGSTGCTMPLRTTMPMETAESSVFMLVLIHHRYVTTHVIADCCVVCISPSVLFLDISLKNIRHITF